MAARVRTALSLGVLPTLLALLLAGGVRGSSTYAQPSDADARASFRRVVEAWQGEDAGTLAGAMEENGRLKLKLRTRSIEGTYGGPQARRVLKAYFTKVSAIRLKDVTPAGHRDDRSYRVRQFEYQYVAEGEGKARTLLRISLKAEGESTWALVAVEELARRRRIR